jgi:hypothetical protein
VTYDPTLGDTREEYDLALALGYDWVARSHEGELIPFTLNRLAQHPFTVMGQHVQVVEYSTDRYGAARQDRRGRAIKRVRLLPSPSPTRV